MADEDTTAQRVAVERSGSGSFFSTHYIDDAASKPKVIKVVEAPDVTPASVIQWNKSDTTRPELSNLLNSKEVRAVMKKFTVKNKRVVEGFLNEKPELLATLKEVPQHIFLFFPSAPLTLTVVDAPAQPERKILGLFIGTTYTPKEASDKMDELFGSDFGEALYAAFDDLYVTVRFA